MKQPIILPLNYFQVALRVHHHEVSETTVILIIHPHGCLICDVLPKGLMEVTKLLPVFPALGNKLTQEGYCLLRVIPVGVILQSGLSTLNSLQLTVPVI